MTTDSNLSSSPGKNSVQRIQPRIAEVGGIPIHRALPSRLRRTVGAWCFLDHAGPATFEPGQGMRVGPHPHIGLQTFTWMIEGEVLHRDSLGNEQIIRPGEVNLMTAGHGISHTEACLDQETRLHAAQLWIALPPEAADCAPAFDHHNNLPRWQEGSVSLTLLAGSQQGHTAPTKLYSPMVGIDLHSEQGGRISLPLQAGFEYGLLPLEGAVVVEGQNFAVDEMAYLEPGRSELQMELRPDSRILLLGGTPRAEEVLIWWNFVGSNKEDIARAQRDWEADSERFGTVHGNDNAPRLTPPPLPWQGY